MNILYIALLMCVVHHVFTSGSDTPSVDKQTALSLAEEDITKSLEVQKFVGAAQEGDVRTMRIVFYSGNDKLKEHCVEHLISLESSERVKLINVCGYASTWILEIIFVYAGKTIFNTVSAEINFTGVDLTDVARNADLVCNTDKFFYLLEKISDKEGQEKAVERGAAALVDANKLEYLDSLFSALEDEPSLGPSMKDIAIRKAFESASFNTVTEDRILYADNFFDYHSILAKSYSVALFQSYSFGGSKGKHFLKLLEKADRQDLEKVKEDEYWFRGQSPEFQEAVNKALKAVGPDARIGIRRRIMEPVLTDLLPKDLFGIIFGYASVAMPKASGEAASANVPLPKKKSKTPNKDASTSTNHGAFGHFHAYMTDRDETAREFGYSPFKV